VYDPHYKMDLFYCLQPGRPGRKGHTPYPQSTAIVAQALARAPFAFSESPIL